MDTEQLEFSQFTEITELSETALYEIANEFGKNATEITIDRDLFSQKLLVQTSMKLLEAVFTGVLKKLGEQKLRSLSIQALHCLSQCIKQARAERYFSTTNFDVLSCKSLRLELTIIKVEESGWVTIRLYFPFYGEQKWQIFAVKQLIKLLRIEKKAVANGSALEVNVFLRGKNRPVKVKLANSKSGIQSFMTKGEVKE